MSNFQGNRRGGLVGTTNTSCLFGEEYAAVLAERGPASGVRKKRPRRERRERVYLTPRQIKAQRAALVEWIFNKSATTEWALQAALVMVALRSSGEKRGKQLDAADAAEPARTNARVVDMEEA